MLIVNTNSLPFQDYSKMRPKYIKKEKEALNEEKNELLSNIHKAKNENTKLKEKMNIVLNDNQKLNKHLNELEIYLSKKLGLDKFELNKQEV